MSKCTSLRFKIYSRDYDKLRKHSESLGTTPATQARLFVQSQINRLPDEVEERDPDFKLKHLESALKHWGFIFDSNFISDSPTLNGKYVSKVLSKTLVIYECLDGVFLHYGNGIDLIPNYHAFPHILRRRVSLLMSRHTIRPQYTS
jgi:hypothetical protein